MVPPTLSFYAALQTAFDHFNSHLFDGHLPPCLITLRSANRVYGYHHTRRFVSPEGQMLDELGLHPGFFTLRPVEAVLSTLVHEMVHHWQEHYGHPSKSTAHNQEWAEKMDSLGLMPSTTGLPGGKRTGRSVSHYIQPDGPYIRACRALLDGGFYLPWLDRHVPMDPGKVQAQQQALEAAGIAVSVTPPPVMHLPARIGDAPVILPPVPPSTQSRIRLCCPQCTTKAWVAEGTELLCGLCKLPMGVSADKRPPKVKVD